MMMKTRLKQVAILIACFLVSVTSIFAEDQKPAAAYPDPAKFESAIEKYEAADAQQMPPTGAIVALGSSTVRLWSEEIGDDLAPLTIIPRGFGGSNMNDALFFVERIAIRYKPRAILLYEGDNDLAQGISPELILETFLKLVAKVQEHLPETRIYVLSIKPSVARRQLWPEAQRANQMLAAECDKDDRLIFLDVATPMLDTKCEIRTDLFIKDNLHMNRTGYELWRDTIKPLLHERELKFEQLAE